MEGAAGAQEVEDIIRLHCLHNPSRLKNKAIRALLNEAVQASEGPAVFLPFRVRGLGALLDIYLRMILHYSASNICCLAAYFIS